MKIFILSITLAFFLVSCSNSIQYSEIKESESLGIEWTWVPYDSDDLQFSGRISHEDGDSAILSWSASAVTIAFVGTALEAKIRTNGHIYLDVFVDGEEDPSSEIESTFLPEEEKTPMVPVVTGLPYGKHVVTLYKRSGTNMGDLFFYGFHVLGRAEKKLLPAKPKRKIEFVGNSITCGTDVLVPDQSVEPSSAYESSYYSYAGQTAKILNAEAHNICCSGHGLIVNYDGSKMFLLPVVYNKIGSNWKLFEQWDHSKWHPDAVVVNLGTNDFASGKNDSARFVNAAVEFIQRIRSYHPKAKIVLLDGPMLVGDYMIKCRRYLDVSKKILEKRGVKNLYRFSFEPRGDSPFGFVAHPNKEQAAEDAESLSAWMRSKFGWN